MQTNKSETINHSNSNSFIFLEYLKSNGFEPSNYEYILELISSAPQSISQFLTDYNQYLLSRNVNYQELKKLNIDGAYGYFGKYGIVVPKTRVNDAHFIYNKVGRITTKNLYQYPKTSEFDVFISNGFSANLINTLKFSQDKYLGFCMDLNDRNLKKIIDDYCQLFKTFQESNTGEYQLYQDKDSISKKQLLLIKKK